MLYQMGSDGGTFDTLVPIDFPAVTGATCRGLCHCLVAPCPLCSACPLLLAPADRAELLVDFSGRVWRKSLQQSFNKCN